LLGVTSRYVVLKQKLLLLIPDYKAGALFLTERSLETTLNEGYSIRYYELCFKDNSELIITPMLVFDLSEIININLTERTHMFNILL